MTYTNSNEQVALRNSAAQLTTSNVTGCFGAIDNGDRWSIDARYAAHAVDSAFDPIRITSP